MAFDRYSLKAAGGDAMFDREGDNVREDFMNAIYNIAPTKTPFMSGIGRGSASDIFTSWQQDDLHAVNPANAAIDGAPAGTDESVKARRVGNVCQISTKVIEVTGRADAVTKAGRSAEMGYQMGKASRSLKRDMEAILTGNQASAIGSGSAASVTGGLRACLRDAAAGESETALVAGDGGNGGAAGTGGVTEATDGTLRGLTETLLRDSIRGCYENGGDPDTIMVAPLLKQRLSEYLYSSSARVAALYSEVGQSNRSGASAQGSIDLYVSDFGVLKIVPNLFQGYEGVNPNTRVRTRDLFVLDMAMWSTLYLRSFRTLDIAKAGDSTKKELLVDYSLQFKQEMASGGVFDIDATVAVTP